VLSVNIVEYYKTAEDGRVELFISAVIIDYHKRLSKGVKWLIEFGGKLQTLIWDISKLTVNVNTAFKIVTLYYWYKLA